MTQARIYADVETIIGDLYASRCPRDPYDDLRALAAEVRRLQKLVRLLPQEDR